MAPVIAQPPGRRRASAGVVTMAIVVGAGFYGFLNLVAFEILMPGAQDVSIRPHYGLLTFFGFAFGPMVGFGVGFLGNSFGDLLVTGRPFDSWWWSVANGLAGLAAGLAAALAWPRSWRGLVLAAAAWSVVATAAGFAFIWIELAMPGQGAAGEILGTEYLPVVIGNSIAAAIITPILVGAWIPLRDFLLPEVPTRR